jgi:hypothetical protein
MTCDTKLDLAVAGFCAVFVGVSYWRGKILPSWTDYWAKPQPATRHGEPARFWSHIIVMSGIGLFMLFLGAVNFWRN